MTVFEIIDAFRDLTKDELIIFLENIKRELDDNNNSQSWPVVNKQGSIELSYFYYKKIFKIF